MNGRNTAKSMVLIQGSQYHAEPFLGSIGGRLGRHQLGGTDERPNTPNRLSHPQRREYLDWAIGAEAPSNSEVNSSCSEQFVTM